MAEFRIVFTMDDAYFREFLEEWVATVGRGWRIDRVMIPVFGLVGVSVSLLAFVYGRWSLLAVGAVATFVAAFEFWKYAGRRSGWLRFCHSLPWFGWDMNIAVRGSVLVQENEYEGDPRFDRTGPIRLTPRGYLVPYVANSPVDTPPEVSDTGASVYIPHRAIVPAVDRDKFAALIGAV